METLEIESIVLVNLLAIAINYSDFSPATQLICTVSASFYTLAKIFKK